MVSNQSFWKCDTWYIIKIIVESPAYEISKEISHLLWSRAMQGNFYLDGIAAPPLLPRALVSAVRYSNAIIGKR